MTPNQIFGKKFVGKDNRQTNITRFQLGDEHSSDEKLYPTQILSDEFLSDELSIQGREGPILIETNKNEMFRFSCMVYIYL